jgi:hypothetical protein
MWELWRIYLPWTMIQGRQILVMLVFVAIANMLFGDTRQYATRAVFIVDPLGRHREVHPQADFHPWRLADPWAPLPLFPYYEVSSPDPSLWGIDE